VHGYSCNCGQWVKYGVDHICALSQSGIYVGSDKPQLKRARGLRAGGGWLYVALLFLLLCALPAMAQEHLTVLIFGTGTITSSPAGISCTTSGGSGCSANLASGTVTLSETPGTGQSFYGWEGGCSGSSSTCTFDLTANTLVTANFTSTTSCVGPPTYSCASTATTGYGNLNYLFQSSVPTGTVNCAASVCTYVSGTAFLSSWTGYFSVNGTRYTISSCTTSACTLTSNPGRLTGATYIKPDQCFGLCQNSVAEDFSIPGHISGTLKITRVTDGSAVYLAHSEAGTVSGGDDTMWSGPNETFLWVATNGGGVQPFQMSLNNGVWQVVNSTSACGSAPPLLAEGGGFSAGRATDANYYYFANGTNSAEIIQGTLTGSGCSLALGTPTTLVNLMAICPGVTPFTPGWVSAFRTSVDEQRFGISLGPTTQGSADWVFVYDRTLGCASYNMNTGNWYAFNTAGTPSTPPTGTMPTGSGYCWGSEGAEGFGIHDIQMNGAGTYVEVAQSLNGSNEAWTNCVGAGPAVLNVSTGVSAWCSDTAAPSDSCEGHEAVGVNDMVTPGGGQDAYPGPNIRNLATIGTFRDFFPTVPEGHLYWPLLSGGVYGDSLPAFYISGGGLGASAPACSGGLGTSPVYCPSYLNNAVFAMPTNLTSPGESLMFSRDFICGVSGSSYAQCMDGIPDGFAQGNAIGVVSPKGDGIAWPTTMLHQLGLDSTGALRGDEVVLYTGFAPAPGIYSPVKGSALTGTSATFQWGGYSGATAFWLDIGSTQGGNNYYSSGSLSNSTFSLMVSTLPSNGSAVYATWYYQLNGTWIPSYYSYTAVGGSSSQGAITSPVPSSTLSGSSVTFTWTAGSGATAYWIDVGSTSGGNNYYSSGNLGNVLTQTVNGLPGNGSAVYVTLYSLVGGEWLSNEYTYTAAPFSAVSGAGVITSPANGSPLSGSSVAFNWTAGASASAYWVDVGSTAGGNNYYSSGNLGNVLTVTANGLPTNGSAVYATLYSLIGGNWTPNAYTYTGYNSAGASGVITTPASGSTLTGSSVTFDWTAGAGASAYWLDVGSTVGGNNYYSSGNLGNVLTTTVSGLPTNGSMIYVTLYSLISGAWSGNAYTYTALTATGGLAALTSPVPGTTLSGMTVTFTWSSDSSATAYWVDIGSTAGGNDVYSSGNVGTTLTTTVYTLPANGNTIYVSLYSYVGGQWLNNPVTYVSGP
jgi:hypothetical protein